MLFESIKLEASDSGEIAGHTPTPPVPAADSHPHRETVSPLDTPQIKVEATLAAVTPEKSSKLQEQPETNLHATLQKGTPSPKDASSPATPAPKQKLPKASKTPNSVATPTPKPKVLPDPPAVVKSSPTARKPSPTLVEDQATRPFCFWKDRCITNLATLRDQAHSPLIQYDYVAVDCEGQEPYIDGNGDDKGITHIGLAYIPSSVPPPMDLPGNDKNANELQPSYLPSADWRRLHAVDLDDVVAAYGIQSASIKLVGRPSGVARENFRYGKQEGVPVERLPAHLDQQVSNLAAKGQTWYRLNMKCQKDSQAAQTQLPCSYDDWSSPSALSYGAPLAESEWCPSPYVKQWQQLIYRNAPPMRLYLAYVQNDIETRMIKQYKIQAAFRPSQWKGSEG